ncbi:MAG: biotin transporter BioY [Clostridiales bacterium]|nr:biotin transporter BioY [Clostridiales bacterium]
MMILISIFAALTAVGAFIKIPLPPVPFTLQIFFVVLSGILLGSRGGLASQLVYIVLGLIGIPIFTEGGGPQYVLNPTFGYLIGFAFAAFIVGKMTEGIADHTFLKYLKATLVGLVVSYAFGVGHLYIILKYISKVPTSMPKILLSGFIVFLPWDIAKMFVASFIGIEVRKRVNFMQKN